MGLWRPLRQMKVSSFTSRKSKSDLSKERVYEDYRKQKEHKIVMASHYFRHVCLCSSGHPKHFYTLSRTAQLVQYP